MGTIGTFFGLDIGNSALNTFQEQEDVTGNNIANANTPGYNDESAIVTQTYPTPAEVGVSAALPGQFGSGVQVSSISRAVDSFLTTSVNDATTQQGTDQSLNSALTTVQTAFNEPGTNGLNNALSTFFNSFSSLENSPSDVSTRQTVVGAAQGLAQMFNTTSSNLQTASGEIGQQVTADMTQVNTLGQQIAGLNKSIMQATALGQQPNTLLDQRDQLINTLSGLTNVTTTAGANGAVNVDIGSTTLVSGSVASSVTLAGLQANGDITGGAVAGLTAAQTDLSNYQTQLDDTANAVITQVNSLQQSGMGMDGSTNVPLFNGTTAATMTVNPTIVNNPEAIAAGAVSSTGTPAAGDGSVAGAIANLATTTMTSGPLTGSTIQGYYTSMVTALGTAVSTSNANLTADTASLTQLQQQQQSVSGVNVDQEMTNMLQYQRSYQAAAQFVNIQDSMLGSLMNMLSGS